jgi:hypothetical protein
MQRMATEAKKKEREQRLVHLLCLPYDSSSTLLYAGKCRRCHKRQRTTKNVRFGLCFTCDNAVKSDAPVWIFTHCFQRAYLRVFSKISNEENWRVEANVVFFCQYPITRIGVSQIQGGGFGLFAAFPFAPNEAVAFYFGRTLRRREVSNEYCVKRLALQGEGRRNVIIVDSRSSNSGAQFVNSHRVMNKRVDKDPHLRRPNVKLTGSGCLLALRHILVGEEILVDYGKDYYFGKNILAEL